MTPPRCHFIHHVPYEGPGRIRDWTLSKGFAISTTWQHLGDPLPDPASIDLAVITGGPMSIHDEAEYSWLATEKQWIRQLLAQGTPLLGICLGAQLIADALGADVQPMGHQEIGWFPIHRTPEAAGHPVLNGIPDPATVLHWHGDRFDIPAHTVRLWESDLCDNQAFVSPQVLGLQFHLEMGREELRPLIEASRPVLTPNIPGIQTENELLNATVHMEDAHTLLTQLLDGWWKQIRSS
jgi:GMP synthase-like glutamine amidotransferase